MTKKNITLTVDEDFLRIGKNRGLKFSKMFDDLLRKKLIDVLKDEEATKKELKEGLERFWYKQKYPFSGKELVLLGGTDAVNLTRESSKREKKDITLCTIYGIPYFTAHPDGSMTRLSQKKEKL